MKQLALIALLFVSLSTFAQLPNPPVPQPPTGSAMGYNKFRGYLIVDSGATVARPDTSKFYSPGYISDFARKAGKMYFWEDGYYKPFGSGGGGGGSDTNGIISATFVNGDNIAGGDKRLQLLKVSGTTLEATIYDADTQQLGYNTGAGVDTLFLERSSLRYPLAFLRLSDTAGVLGGLGIARVLSNGDTTADGQVLNIKNFSTITQLSVNGLRRVAGTGTFGLATSTNSPITLQTNNTGNGAANVLTDSIPFLANRTFQFPDASGTFALRSDFAPYIKFSDTVGTIATHYMLDTTVAGLNSQIILKVNYADSGTIYTTPYQVGQTISDSLLLYIPIAEKGVANGVATLGADGKLPNSQLPALAITDVFVVNSQAAMLALSAANQGDVAIRTDLQKSFILAADPYSTLSNWQELLSPTAPSTNLTLGTNNGITQVINNDNGTGVTIPGASGSVAGLLSASDYSKLAGIAAGAEVNVQSDWNAVSGDAFILNKPVSLPPSGAAGGDLSGTYPNPQVVDYSHNHIIANVDGLQDSLNSRLTDVPVEDNRDVYPDELPGGKIKFGFGSWNNNTGSPYADFLHFNTYTDGSGGNQNLLMLSKSGIGVRVYQNTWNAGTLYSVFKDVAFTDQIPTSANFISNQFSSGQTAEWWITGNMRSNILAGTGSRLLEATSSGTIQATNIDVGTILTSIPTIEDIRQAGNSTNSGILTGVGFDLGRVAIGKSGGGYGVVGENMDFTSTSNTYNYKYNDFAVMMDMASGQINFKTAPVGTPGNPITFTNRLTITASGDVNIVNESGSGNRLSYLESDGTIKRSTIDPASIPTTTSYGAIATIIGPIAVSCEGFSYTKNGDYIDVYGTLVCSTAGNGVIGTITIPAASDFTSKYDVTGYFNGLIGNSGTGTGGTYGTIYADPVTDEVNMEIYFLGVATMDVGNSINIHFRYKVQ